jgi:hypothetical protein
MIFHSGNLLCLHPYPLTADLFINWISDLPEPENGRESIHEYETLKPANDRKRHF